MKRVSVLLVAVLSALLPETVTGAEDRPFGISVFFWHESPLDEMAFEGIREGFRLSGVEHVFEVRQAYGDEQKAAEIIADLAAAKPDLIYAMGTGATRRLMKVVTDTPIVFTAVTNPVQSGITPDWRSSGRNIAGNSNWIPTGEILEEFTEVVRGLKRLGVMYDPDNAVSAMEIREAGKVVGGLGITLVAVHVKAKDDLAPAARRLAGDGVDAVWVPIDILVYKNLGLIKPVTVPAGIPLLASSHRGVKDGAIYGEVVDYHTLGQRSVIIALKILAEGVPPADIPIETLSSHRSMVNMRAAREIGFDFPMEVLVKAREVIR